MRRLSKTFLLTLWCTHGTVGGETGPYSTTCDGRLSGCKGRGTCAEGGAVKVRHSWCSMGIGRWVFKVLAPRRRSTPSQRFMKIDGRSASVHANPPGATPVELRVLRFYRARRQHGFQQSGYGIQTDRVGCVAFGLIGFRVHFRE